MPVLTASHDDQQPTPRPDGIHRLTTFTPDERATIAQLAARCNATEGLTLKLPLSESDATTADALAFVWVADGALVGYCALDDSDGAEAELCGMVHPDYRRRGIGRALLAAAQRLAAELGVTRLLLICERAASSGQAFIAALNAPGAPSASPTPVSPPMRLAFAEHHMERPAALAPEEIAVADAADAHNPSAVLRVRDATVADVETLAAITAGAFDDPFDAIRQGIADDVASGAERWLLGEVDGIAVGSLRVVPMPTATPQAGERQVGVYGFGVLPTRQGQGWGKRIMRATMALLRAEGWTHFSLEVETENARAFAVYRSCGFVVITTYEYYTLASARI